MIAALLLAAGRGRRFGGDKLLAPLDGRPVIRWSAETLAGCTDAMFVVVPPKAHAIAGALDGLDVVLVTNMRRDDGMGSSIAAGVAALPGDVDAVILALGDQPRISHAVVARLILCWRETDAAAVAPRYADGRGHPVLFAKSCFGALARLAGDEGARGVLETLGDALRIVDVEGRIPLDVDTPAALRSLGTSG